MFQDKFGVDLKGKLSMTCVFNKSETSIDNKKYGSKDIPGQYFLSKLWLLGGS